MLCYNILSNCDSSYTSNIRNKRKRQIRNFQKYIAHLSQSQGYLLEFPCKTVLHHEEENTKIIKNDNKKCSYLRNVALLIDTACCCCYCLLQWGIVFLVSTGITVKGLPLIGFAFAIATLPSGVFAQYYKPYRSTYSRPSYRPTYTKPSYQSPSQSYQQYQIRSLQQQQYRQQQINQSNSIRQTCIGGVGPGC